MTVSQPLFELYEKDRKDRARAKDDDVSIKAWEKRDRQTIARFRVLEKQVDFSEIWNCHYAAYFLMHSSLLHDLHDAHTYAKKAVDMGSNVTKWLYAATYDRYLVAQGKKQKFGTQFQKKDEAWQLMPYDESTTDEERAMYGVTPLKKAVETFHRKYANQDT